MYGSNPWVRRQTFGCGHHVGLARSSYAREPFHLEKTCLVSFWKSSGRRRLRREIMVEKDQERNLERETVQEGGDMQRSSQFLFGLVKVAPTVSKPVSC